MIAKTVYVTQRVQVDIDPTALQQAAEELLLKLADDMHSDLSDTPLWTEEYYRNNMRLTWEDLLEYLKKNNQLPERLSGLASDEAWWLSEKDLSTALTPEEIGQQIGLPVSYPSFEEG